MDIRTELRTDEPLALPAQIVLRLTNSATAAEVGRDEALAEDWDTKIRPIREILDFPRLVIEPSSASVIESLNVSNHQCSWA